MTLVGCDIIAVGICRYNEQWQHRFMVQSRGLPSSDNNNNNPFFQLFFFFALAEFTALFWTFQWLKCSYKIAVRVYNIRVWQRVMSSLDQRNISSPATVHHYSYIFYTKKRSFWIKKMALSRLSSNGTNNGTRALRFTEDGTFKISIFSDLHYGECERERSLFLFLEWVLLTLSTSPILSRTWKWRRDWKYNEQDTCNWTTTTGCVEWRPYYWGCRTEVQY